MDIPALFISFTTLLILILAFALVGLILLSLDKVPRVHRVLAHRQHRELLRHKVYQYRLASMLRYLGIPMDYYMSNLPEDEIKKHIYRCDSCPNIETCDRCLRDGEGINDMRFCPNYESLMANKTVAQ
jgi:hypothetical protein